MKRLALLPVVLLLVPGAARVAWAEPAWGANCLSCHDGLLSETVYVFGEDTEADPDESATGAPDRGALKVFEAFRGEIRTLQAEVLWLDPDDTYAVELKRLRFPGVEDGGELTYGADCAWAEWTAPGDYYSDPVVKYDWGSGPTVFAYDIEVHPDAPYDYYDLVFAVAGKFHADGSLFYGEEHFYLRVSPEVVPEAVADDEPKNRYISFMPNHDGFSTAYEVEMTASTHFPGSTGVLGWVGEPFEAPEDPGVWIAPVEDAPFYSDSWPSIVNLGDCEIVPAATFALRGTVEGTSVLSDPLELGTIVEPAPKKWADCVGAFTGAAWAGPNGVVNMDDVMAAVQKFLDDPTAPPLTWVDIDAEVPNAVLNFTDILQIVQGFKGNPYPFSAPADCE